MLRKISILHSTIYGMSMVQFVHDPLIFHHQEILHSIISRRGQLLNFGDESWDLSEGQEITDNVLHELANVSWFKQMVRRYIDFVSVVVSCVRGKQLNRLVGPFLLAYLYRGEVGASERHFFESMLYKVGFKYNLFKEKEKDIEEVAGI